MAKGAYRRGEGLDVIKAISIETKLAGGTGGVLLEHKPKGKRGAKLYMRPQTGSKIFNPALDLAWSITKDLRRPPVPDCQVYDAHGKLIAVINGETRERRSV